MSQVQPNQFGEDQPASSTSGESDHSPDESPSITSVFTDVARMSAALFAGLYLVGLLIVNINLAQYDLVTLDLARSEYILTGTLWAFFAGLTYVAYHEARRALEHTTDSKTTRLLMSAGSFVILLWAFRAVSGTFQYWAFLSLCLSMAIGWFFTRQYYARVGPILWRHAFRPHQMTRDETTYVAHQCVGLLLFLLAALSIYSLGAFPTLAARYGGGERPLVTVYLNDTFPVSEGIPGIAVSPDRKKVGPVRWLLENGSMVAVAGDIPRKGRYGAFLPQKNSSAVLIDKRLISAVVYLAPDESGDSVFRQRKR
ncbi:MAG: hypothetical protein ACLQU2_12130 [Candidatus Binataceae bacterium]